MESAFVLYLSSKRKYIIYVIIILLRNKVNLNFVLGVRTNISPKLSACYAGKSHEDSGFSQDDSSAFKPVNLSSLLKTHVTLLSSNNPVYVNYVSFKRCAQVQKWLKKPCKNR